MSSPSPTKSPSDDTSLPTQQQDHHQNQSTVAGQSTTSNTNNATSLPDMKSPSAFSNSNLPLDPTMGVSTSSIGLEEGGGSPALPILRQQYFDGVDASQSRQDESTLTSNAVSTGVVYSNSQGSISHLAGGASPQSNHVTFIGSEAHQSGGMAVSAPGDDLTSDDDDDDDDLNSGYHHNVAGQRATGQDFDLLQDDDAVPVGLSSRFGANTSPQLHPPQHQQPQQQQVSFLPQQQHHSGVSSQFGGAGVGTVGSTSAISTSGQFTPTLSLVQNQASGGGSHIGVSRVKTGNTSMEGASPSENNFGQFSTTSLPFPQQQQQGGAGSMNGTVTANQFNVSGVGSQQQQSISTSGGVNPSANAGSSSSTAQQQYSIQEINGALYMVENSPVPGGLPKIHGRLNVPTTASHESLVNIINAPSGNGSGSSSMPPTQFHMDPNRSNTSAVGSPNYANSSLTAIHGSTGTHFSSVTNAAIVRPGILLSPTTEGGIQQQVSSNNNNLGSGFAPVAIGTSSAGGGSGNADFMPLSQHSSTGHQLHHDSASDTSLFPVASTAYQTSVGGMSIASAGSYTNTNDFPNVRSGRQRSLSQYPNGQQLSSQQQFIPSSQSNSQGIFQQLGSGQQPPPSPPIAFIGSNQPPQQMQPQHHHQHNQLSQMQPPPQPAPVKDHGAALRSPDNVFICMLALNVRKQHVIELFAPFGEIISCEVRVDIHTGVSKGHGFVKFATADAADRAVAALDGFVFHGRRLQVRHADAHADMAHLKETHTIFLRNVPVRMLQWEKPLPGTTMGGFAAGSGEDDSLPTSPLPEGGAMPRWVIAPNATLREVLSAAGAVVDMKPLGVLNPLPPFPSDDPEEELAAVRQLGRKVTGNSNSKDHFGIQPADEPTSKEGYQQMSVRCSSAEAFSVATSLICVYVRYEGIPQASAAIELLHNSTPFASPELGGFKVPLMAKMAESREQRGNRKRQKETMQAREQMQQKLIDDVRGGPSYHRGAHQQQQHHHHQQHMHYQNHQQQQQSAVFPFPNQHQQQHQYFGGMSNGGGVNNQHQQPMFGGGGGDYQGNNMPLNIQQQQYFNGFQQQQQQNPYGYFPQQQQGGGGGRQNHNTNIQQYMPHQQQQFMQNNNSGYLNQGSQGGGGMNGFQQQYQQHQQQNGGGMPSYQQFTQVSGGGDHGWQR